MLDDAAGTITAPSVCAEGGGSGSSDSGAAPTSEAEPITGTPAEGGDAPPPEGEQEPGAESDQPPREGTEEDNRVLPKWIRGLKEADPEGFKRAKTDFFDLKERRTDFPTVADARKAKSTIEALGGTAGIAEMQEDRDYFKGAATKFLDGDPGFAQE